MRQDIRCNSAETKKTNKQFVTHLVTVWLEDTDNSIVVIVLDALHRMPSIHLPFVPSLLQCLKVTVYILYCCGLLPWKICSIFCRITRKQGWNVKLYISAKLHRLAIEDLYPEKFAKCKMLIFYIKYTGTHKVCLFVFLFFVFVSSGGKRSGCT